MVIDEINRIHKYTQRWKKRVNLRPPPLTGASSTRTWLEDDKTELRYPILLLKPFSSIWLTKVNNNNNNKGWFFLKNIYKINHAKGLFSNANEAERSPDSLYHFELTIIKITLQKQHIHSKFKNINRTKERKIEKKNYKSRCEATKNVNLGKKKKNQRSTWINKNFKFRRQNKSGYADLIIRSTYKPHNPKNWRIVEEKHKIESRFERKHEDSRQLDKQKHKM